MGYTGTHVATQPSNENSLNGGREAGLGRVTPEKWFLSVSPKLMNRGDDRARQTGQPGTHAQIGQNGHRRRCAEHDPLHGRRPGGWCNQRKSPLPVYYCMLCRSICNSILPTTSLPDHHLPVNRIWVRDPTHRFPWSDGTWQVFYDGVPDSRRRVPPPCSRRI